MNSNPFNLQLTASPQEFHQCISPFVAGKETKYNLFCGLLNHALNAKSPSEFPLMGTCGSWDSIQFAFLQTPGRNLILIGDSCRRIDDFVFQLYEHVPQIPGIVTSRMLGEKFAQNWCRLSGNKFNIDMQQWIYELQELIAPRFCEGQFRLAESKDLTWLTQAAEEFHKEAIPHDQFNSDQFQKVLNANINRQKIGVWQVGDQTVSVGMLLRPYLDSICIGFVYTPRQFRNRGIASALTHALCLEARRQSYHRIVLYTDASNKPSNHVYQKLGFVKIDEGLMGRFV